MDEFDFPTFSPPDAPAPSAPTITDPFSSPPSDFSPPQSTPQPGFDFGHFFDSVGTAAKWAWPAVQIGKVGLDAWTGINAQKAQADYQKQLEAYYANRTKIETAYNQQVSDYLKQRAAWEQQVLGMEQGAQEQFQGAQQAFQDSLGTFQGSFQQFQGKVLDATAQAKALMESQIAEAMPLLKQSGQLLEPAIAALAKGEVPPGWAPIIDQFKQRARAAGMQALASSGIESGTAEAHLTAEIDQQASALLQTMASAAAGQGQNLAQLGLAGLQQAAGTIGQEVGAAGTGANIVGSEVQAAQAGLDPVMREFLAMLQSLQGLTGGFPSPLTGGPPPPPVA